MVINSEILVKAGAELIDYSPGTFIFKEGTPAKYYYQIAEGTVKLNNYFEDGREFVHGFPCEGHFLGEGYVFIENNYAINAISEGYSSIYRLAKPIFLEMLRKDPQLYNAILCLYC